MTQHWTENSTRLKLLVGVMTTLLIIGLILLVVGIAKTSKDLSDAGTQNLGDLPVDFAHGDELIDLTADDGRLYIGIKHKDGRQTIKVIDASNGRSVGQFILGEKP